MPARGKRPRRTQWTSAWPSVRHRRQPLLGLIETVRAFLSRNRDVIRSLVIYGWCLGVLLLFYTWLDGTVIFQRFLEYNAQATGFLAGSFEPGATVSGRIVESEGFAISIVEECTSLAPLAIYIAAILAFPASFSRKLLGIVLGVVALSAVNLVRTTSLFYVGSAFPETLEVVHLLVWQSLMVIFAVALWLLWMRRWGYHGRA